MSTKIEETVETLRSTISDEQLDTMVNRFTLSDAIRLGSTVTDQAYEWGNGETACALTAAALSSKAAGYMK